MSLADARAEKRSDFNLILRLPLWSGCRRSGARGMAWSELEDGRWTVPKGRTKNHRPLVLLLPRQALDALAGWPRFFGQDHLFGRGTDGFQGWSKAKARVGLEYDLHDLGCTVETRLAALGAPKEISSRVRNHATGPITEGYDHWSYGPEKAAALQRLGRRARANHQQAGRQGLQEYVLGPGPVRDLVLGIVRRSYICADPE